MSDSDNRGQIVPSNRGQGKIITVGGAPSVDLSFLPEHEQQALLRAYASGMVDIAKKAQELNVDVNVLRDTLNNLADTTRTVSESGNAITVTHTQTSKVGRTEIKMGNTDEAKSGKLSRSQTGERDWTPYYIFAGLVAVVLIALIFAAK
jgi:hypothetical protein